MELMFTDLNKFTESKRKGRLDEACYIAEVAQVKNVKTELQKGWIVEIFDNVKTETRK